MFTIRCYARGVRPFDSRWPEGHVIKVLGSANTVETETAAILIENQIGVYGNFDIILDHYARGSQPYTTPNAPCGGLYLVLMLLLGCRLVLAIRWCGQSNVYRPPFSANQMAEMPVDTCDRPWYSAYSEPRRHFAAPFVGRFHQRRHHSVVYTLTFRCSMLRAD